MDKKPDVCKSASSGIYQFLFLDHLMYLRYDFLTKYPLLMDFRIIWCSVIIMFLAVACSEQEHTFFDEEISYQPIVAGQEFVFDEILMPRKMRVIGQRLLVSDFSNQPPFHVLEIENSGSLSYLKGTGAEGEGAGELIMIEDFINADSLVYVYDSQQHKLVGYDRGLNAPQTEDIKLAGEGQPLNFYSLPDGQFASVGIFYDARFKVYDNIGRVERTHGELTGLENNLTGRALALSWYSFSAHYPGDDLLYLFSSNSDHIEKYSTESGELLKTVKGNRHPYPRMQLETVDGQTWPVDDGSIYSYLWADSDGRYIYALYSGELQSEIEGFKADKIHVLDRGLNLVAAYELGHYPFTMAADGNGGIYTVTHTNNGAVFRHIQFDELQGG